jgi:hypothetical protein
MSPVFERRSICRLRHYICQRLSALFGCRKRFIGIDFESISPGNNVLSDFICAENIALIVTDQEANSAWLKHSQGGG